MVAGWADDVAEVVFDAVDGTGVREARLKIDGTVRANATYECDFTQSRPCANQSGASLAANVADLASGLHTWQLEVVDGAGNVASTPATQFAIDWIREAIVAQMSLPNSDIVSVGNNEESNVLDVGMTNPTGLEATDLKARFGDAIAIQQEEEIEGLAGNPAGDPVPGADTKRDPMLAGVHIWNGRTGDDAQHCTSGFMFSGRRTDNFKLEGVITAGHCVWADPLTTEWLQGGDRIGPYFAHRFVEPKTFADAGAISTCCGFGDFRDISNRVFVGAGEPTVRIRRIATGSSGRKGDPACISGAYGGFSCGVIDKVGHETTPSGLRRGFEYRIRDRGRRVIVRNVYRMRRERGTCKVGDSGAPVFNLTGSSQGIAFGTAMGIAFAKTTAGQSCYFSQQPFVEYELNVRTYTDD